MMKKENNNTTDLTLIHSDRLDANSISMLKEQIKKSLAPYLEAVNCKDIKLMQANFDKRSQTQWFGFSAKCPICHGDNTTGYCMVGIDTKFPYGIKFCCHRFAKATSYIQTDMHNKSYAVVPMGTKDGKDISDTYVMAYQRGQVSYWIKDINKSQN